MKSKRLLTSLILLAVMFACTMVSVVYAWFVNTLITSPEMTSHIYKSYFESGDGSGETQYQNYDENGESVITIDPVTGEPLTSQAGCAYEIKYPIQFYYFAWLQALGYFNQNIDQTTEVEQIYFYLSADLDMTGWILPQIGTQSYPFVGNFNGNGHTISNLVVQNIEVSGGETWKDKPNEDVSGLNIVGVFGVIGALNNEGLVNAAVDVGGNFVPSPGYTYNSALNEVKNCIIEDARIKTAISDSLVGVAAGYVNGKMENVKIVGGTLENVGATTALSYTTNLSDFGAVGFVTADYRGQNNVTTVKVYDPQVISSGGAGSQQQGGNNWGNSVDMLSMYESLRAVYTTNSNTNATTYTNVTITHHVDGTVTESYSGPGTAALSVGNYPIRVTEITEDGQVIASYSLVQRDDTSDFVYLYGESATGTYTQAVTDVYEKNAFYIYHDNDTTHNFSFANNTFSDATRANATKWVIEEDENEETIIYTIIGANKYYLVSDNGNLSYISAGVDADIPSGATRWVITDDTISDGRYNLCYQNGAWDLVDHNKLLITDDFEENAKHYLTVSNLQIANTNSSDASVSWNKVMFSEDEEEKDFYLYTIINGHNYYLKNNEGLLALEVDPVTPSTKWRYKEATETEKSKVYTIVNEDGDGYALYYDAAEGIENWALTDFSEVHSSDSEAGDSFGDSINMVTIYNRLSAAYDNAMRNTVEYTPNTTVTNILDAQGNVVSSSTSADASARNIPTIISYEDGIGSYSFARHPSGTKQYLYLYGEDNIGETNYALGYLVAVNNGYRITDGQGNYLQASTNSFTNVTREADATTFTLNNNGRISFTSGYTTYYLGMNQGTLYPSNSGVNTQPVWDTSDGIHSGNYYVLYGDGRWYSRLLERTYTYNNLTGNSFYIQSETGEYYTAFGKPAIWTFSTLSGRGTVSTFDDNGVQYYIGKSNNNQLTLTQNSYTWSIEGSNIYDGNYYITYNNGWGLTQSRTYYLISSGNNYLNATAGGVARGTSAAQATKWTLSNANANVDTTVSTVINGTTYYLNLSGTGNNRTITTSTTTQNWRRSGTASGTLQSRTNTSYYVRYSNANNNPWSANRTGTTLTYTQGFEAPQYSTLSLSQSLLDGITYSTVEFTTNSTYLPLSVDDETGDIDKRNTGYIIGGSFLGTDGYDMPGQYGRGDIRVSYYAVSNISQSTTNNKLVLTKIRTIDADGDKLLSDNYVSSHFFKLNSDGNNEGSLAKMNSVLATNVYGLHFMNAAISQNNTTIVNNAKINGKTYSVFELPNDVIDFTLKERGYINFFAGTYFSGNDSFFSLHKIERGEDGLLISIKEILEIYGHGNDPYIYKLKSNNGTITYESWEYFPSGAIKSHTTYTMAEVTAAGYTSVFNTSWIKKQNSLTSSAVYYFEIPVDQGEYALGSVDGGTGAYLMYLDIGAAGTALKPEGNAKLEETIFDDLTVLHSDAGTVDYTVAGGTRDANINTNPTYYPLAWDDDTVAEGNTGYVISGANNASTPPGDIRVSRYSKYAQGNWGSIRNSLTSTDNAGVLNNSRVYTIVNGTQQSITEYGIGNQYTLNYSVAENALNGLLEGQQYVYGLHFMQSSISSSRVVTVPKVVINGVTYYDYVMPEDCIDFVVAERGRITFMAGTYFSGSRVNSFFSLHRVFRDASNNIIEIKELSEIYSNGSSDLYIYRYVGDNNYYYSNGTEAVALPSGYVRIFDTSVIRSNNANLTMNSVYYFEIPVDAGEFALGSASGDGAYLLYLDIAANAGFSMKTTITEVYEITIYELLYPEGVAFVDATDSVAYDTDGKVDPEKSVFLSIPISNSNGGTVFTIDEDGNMVVTNETSSLAGFEAKSLVPGGSLVVNNGSVIDIVGRVIITEKVTDIVSTQDGSTITTVTTTVTTIVNGVVEGTVVTRTVTTTLGGNTTTVNSDPPIYDGHSLIPIDYTLDTPDTARAILVITYKGMGMSSSVARVGNLNYVDSEKAVTVDEIDFGVFDVVKPEGGDEDVYAGVYEITISADAGTYPLTIESIDGDFSFTINGNVVSAEDTSITIQ